MDIYKQLLCLGEQLPRAPKPVGRYVACSVTDRLAFASGQLPLADGKMRFSGKLGDNLQIQQGQRAAALCALNALAQLEQQGLLNRVKQIVKVDGMINAAPDFTGHAQVLDGASELFFKVLGEKAGHSRTVMGCTSLPQNAAVELAIVVELSPQSEFNRKNDGSSRN